jgi:Protein of unknown function (DUF3108)
MRNPIILVVSLLLCLLPANPETFPFPQKLSYRVEWRMVTAGSAELEFTRSGANNWGINLDLESAGIVTRLYRVSDKYRVTSNDRFCGASATLDAQEGKRHNLTQLSFDNVAHKVLYDQHDLIKDLREKKELPIEPCTHEVAGALASLGQLNLQPGSSVTVPITNGKKMVNARVDAQAKETIHVDGKPYQTIRYEAFLFDNVLYKRKGRLFLWITDDAERTPVQFRIQLGFPIGTISLELEKQQKL